MNSAAKDEPIHHPGANGVEGEGQVSATERSMSVGPYVNSAEHLADELCRIDHLVRAQTERWKRTIAVSKSSELWGMVHVTDAEIDSYLNSAFVRPGVLANELETALAADWQAAALMNVTIRSRLEQTGSAQSLRLEELGSLFALSDLERDVILLCLLPELDARYRRLFGYLQDDVSRSSPTVELILQILYPLISEPHLGRQLFSVASPLVKFQLIVVGGDARSDEPLSMRTVRIDERVANYILGSDVPDRRLERIVSESTTAVEWDQLVVNQSRIAYLQRLADWCRRQIGLITGTTLFLHGGYGSGRLATAQAMCNTTGSSLLVADLAAAVRSNSFEQLVDLAYREAALRGAALYWSNCEALLDSNQQQHLWDFLINAAGNGRLTFLSSSTLWEPAGQFHNRMYQRLDFPTLNYELRRQLWKAELPQEEHLADRGANRDLLAEQLANGFQLTAGQIRDALDAARKISYERDPEAGVVSVADLYEACRRQSSRRLMTLARRIEPRTDLTFDDLVMPGPNRMQLMELRSRIRHRSRVYNGLGFEQRVSMGKGLIALFTGSSGTGKTMAAELLAREQGVDLYKVDLSAVVSKYVGETEKNLSRVFAEAEDVNAILFFDEADALFGKRGEVKEAQDRWANMEVNYLLQRVEEYAGVVILASNLRQNIDEAFMRRIHVIVEFPFPEAAARFRILTSLFPAGLERPADDELMLLTERFKLAGGSLKNIVLDAAFRALTAKNGTAKNGGPPAITSRHLAAGVAREYQKLGRPITRSEFGDDFFDFVDEDIL
jgi:ATPase family associated with various cellular activities (AAA)